MQERQATVETIRRRLAPILARPEVELVVLFGSRASNNATDSSDIDLAIAVTPGADVALIADGAMHVLATDQVDVVDLGRAPPLLMMEIARRGIPVYQAHPAAFAAFASLALRRFNDTAKLRREREKGITAFLAERGLL